MHRDPVPHSYTDRSDLAIFNPDAGESFPRGGANSINGQQFNEQIFQPAQVAMQILPASAQVENWISNQ